MSEGDQDHSGVPVTIAVIAYGLDQALDLLLGQVLPCPQLLILQTPRNCSIYARWGDPSEAWFGHIISRFGRLIVGSIHFFRTVVKTPRHHQRSATSLRLPAAGAHQ